MDKVRKLTILNAIAFAAHVSVSYLSQFKLINTKDVGEISDSYPSLFTPAGITFAIWGLIYAGLLSFSIYHLVMARKHDLHHPANKDILSISYLLIINNLGAAAWVIAWTHEHLTLSVVLILIQLIALISIHLRLKLHDARRSLASKTFTQFPLSLYTGWITIAVIANISSWLSAIHWSGWGVSDINWALTMIGVAILLTLSVISRKKNVFFGMVVIWALYGILLKRKAIEEETYEPIIMLCWAGMGIILLACLLALIRNLTKKTV